MAMEKPASDLLRNKTARVAGLLYLIMALCSAFGMIYVDSKIYVAGDAAATAGNIQAFAGLIRLGFVSSLVAQISFLFLVYVLYKLLKSVDIDLARIMVVLVVASVPLTCLNLLNQLAPLILLNGAGYASAFDPAQLHALAMMFLDLHKQGIFIAQIFWGLWLFPLGILVFRSGFIPKVLGILLVIAGIGYLVDSLSFFLVPNLGISVSSVTFIGELLFLLWLLIKGVNERELTIKEPA